MILGCNSMKLNWAMLFLAIALWSIANAEEVKQQKIVVKAEPEAGKPAKSFGCPGSNNGGDKEGTTPIADEKYLHSWENGKRPPLSTLKMVCKDLSDLKTGDFVFITVQGKEEVYELAGTDFGKEGSVYKVERNGDTFAFKHPSTTGFLFFNSPSYYVGVKRDSDVLDMFQSFDNSETSFKLCYHEKLNGFVMKNVSNDKCMTVCEKLFGHSPCFRKDQCAAVRIYKIPAYCLQRQKPSEAKANNKGTKKEQLEKIKQKEALVNTAKASGRGQSTATAPTSGTNDSSQETPGKFVPVREVRVNKKIVVHRRLPRDQRPTAQALDTSTNLTKSCTVSISSIPGGTTSIQGVCTCKALPCTCALITTTSIPIYNTSTSTVRVFITSKPITSYVTSSVKTMITSTRFTTHTVPVTTSQVVTLTSKIRTVTTHKVSITSTRTIPVTTTSVIFGETAITTLCTSTTTVKPVPSTSSLLTTETFISTVNPITETLISTPFGTQTTTYPTITCYTTETIDTYI